MLVDTSLMEILATRTPLVLSSATSCTPLTGVGSSLASGWREMLLHVNSLVNGFSVPPGLVICQMVSVLLMQWSFLELLAVDSVAPCVRRAFDDLAHWSRLHCPNSVTHPEVFSPACDARCTNLMKAMLFAQLPWPALALTADHLGAADKLKWDDDNVKAKKILTAKERKWQPFRSVSLAVLTDRDGPVVEQYLSLSGSRVPFRHEGCQVEGDFTMHAADPLWQPLPFWLKDDPANPLSNVKFLDEMRIVWATERPGDAFYFGELARLRNETTLVDAGDGSGIRTARDAWGSPYAEYLWPGFHSACSEDPLH